MFFRFSILPLSAYFIVLISLFRHLRFLIYITLNSLLYPLIKLLISFTYRSGSNALSPIFFMFTIWFLCTNFYSSSDLSINYQGLFSSVYELFCVVFYCSDMIFLTFIAPFMLPKLTYLNLNIVLLYFLLYLLLFLSLFLLDLDCW